MTSSYFAIFTHCSIKLQRKQRHLVVRLGACDLFLYDGNVDDSFRRHRNANCDGPERKHVNNMWAKWLDLSIPSLIPSPPQQDAHSPSYQYVLCTWLYLLRLRMCSTTSSLLASRRAPDISFSRLRHGNSWESDLIFIPDIILQSTGSTEEMDVPPDSSKETSGR